MSKRKFTVERKTTGDVYHVTARGREVLSEPLLNRGIAFTEEQREQLEIKGLIAYGKATLEEQAERVWEQVSAEPTPLLKNIALTAMHDRNEVLFYRTICDHMHETFPLIYDPVIGEAIEKHSHIYRRPRGIYLSIDDPESIETAFDNLGLGTGDVDIIACSDAEEILGIGDWGVAGVDIVIGKLAVYTAAAGIHPARVVPVGLDVGTDRRELLEDNLYMGCRHPRIRGEKYDAFIDKFVSVVKKRFPGSFLHWEDFGPGNARRLINKYRQSFCTFNDDMQGTGAITLAGILSGCRVTGVPIRNQRVVVFGAGTAGVGIADQIRDAMVQAGLSHEDATSQIWCLASHGLLYQGMPKGMRDFQESFARPENEMSRFNKEKDGSISLAEVVRIVKPTILIGTSTRPGAFTEEIVKDMASHCERPMIFPLSNPTELHEAKPVDLIRWTKGKALVATGAPFAPVTYNGVTYVIPQANNAMLYPGLGLGIVTCKAKLVTDGMIAAAAEAVSEMSDVSGAGAPLLPMVSDLRRVSAIVAQKVIEKAIEEKVATLIPEDIESIVAQAMWQPVYPEIVVEDSGGENE
ncbi:malic protein NAD-binding protein [Methanolacinia petrolearia DSM 11571]|uniref:Malic protein NAD-binding protein n=1 Tax=Methanolacinia petrolearia (strain DSM 11571 / OCM 486 / SEBR 4847) TaxID=679926 RepID=E1RKK6_METP4|nr:NAD-dependent malic enzyme [Methanolacinia petrolearia]ADN35859.1 malic protein NAD-binding protein [Methanolacinia petrolearia DSM 11571]